MRLSLSPSLYDLFFSFISISFTDAASKAASGRDAGGERCRKRRPEKRGEDTQQSHYSHLCTSPCFDRQKKVTCLLSHSLRLSDYRRTGTRHLCLADLGADSRRASVSLTPDPLSLDCRASESTHSERPLRPVLSVMPTTRRRGSEREASHISMRSGSMGLFSSSLSISSSHASCLA